MKYAFLSFLLLGCTTTVSRDRSTYVSELNFIDRVIRDGAPANREYVESGCTCANGGWRANASWATDIQCARHAEWWTVFASRWEWHLSMMMFNAGVTTTRPAAVGAIPPVTCTLPGAP